MCTLTIEKRAYILPNSAGKLWTKFKKKSLCRLQNRITKLILMAIKFLWMIAIKSTTQSLVNFSFNLLPARIWINFISIHTIQKTEQNCMFYFHNLIFPCFLTLLKIWGEHIQYIFKNRCFFVVKQKTTVSNLSVCIEQ